MTIYTVLSAEAQTPRTLNVLIEPLKNIYSAREGVTLKLQLQAQDATRVCLQKNILSQLNFTVSRSGKKLKLAPFVVKDNSVLFQQPTQVRFLKSGQTLTYRINLRRLQFMDGSKWEPGEYNLAGSFNLCEQSEAREYSPEEQDTPIPAKTSGWFMISN